MNTTPGNLNGRKSGYSNTTQTVVTTEDYTPTEADGGVLLEVDSAADREVILTANVAAGFSVMVMQRGTGAVFFGGPVGTTIVSRGNRFTLAGRYACAEARCIGPGEWVICGDVIASE